MKTLLTLLTCLFLLSPTVVMGQSLDGIVQKGSDFLCKSTGVGCPETIDAKDLVEREGLYYKKFTDVPFTGEVDGRSNGSFKNGMREGLWVIYHKNGQLKSRGDYKNGKKNWTWKSYFPDGTIDHENTGKYKNDVKVSD